MSSAPEPGPKPCPSFTPRLRRRRLAVGIVLLTLLTAVLQGQSVWSGLILDDYNHRAELRDGDWSFRSLVNASHLGDPRRRVQMWWQSGADLYFFRPVAFAFLRATYVIGGWRPEATHLASLGWGVICSSLVLMLAWLSTGRFGWGLLAGVLFLMHPNNTGTPRWIACQNEQMATAFTLAALLVYGRGAGWWGWGERRGDTETRIRGENESQESSSFPASLRPRVSASASFLYAVVAVLCYILALGCRESAIFMPVFFVVGDLVYRTPRTARVMLRYGLLAVIAVVYLLIRHHMLGPVTIPGRPYAWPPSEPGFVAFIAEKFVYYILGLWAFLPIIGFAGQEQMRAHPGVFYGLFVVVVAAWIFVLRLMHTRPNNYGLLWDRLPAGHSDRQDAGPTQGNPQDFGPMQGTPRGVWLWLAVAIVPLGPVLPVFAASHHLYLASAGMSIASIMALRELLDWAERRATVMCRVLRVVVMAVVPLLLLVFTGANVALEQGMAGMSAACRLPAAQAVRFGREPRINDKLFFINLPMLAFNCMPAIEEARGVAPLHGHVLTFAPKFVFMDRPTHIEQVGSRQLRVWLDEPAYFSGLIGQSILQGIDRDRPFAPGETFTTPDFNVQVTRATDVGVQEFLFTFAKPLTDPTYHFFLASPVFDAYPLMFK